MTYLCINEDNEIIGAVRCSESELVAYKEANPKISYLHYADFNIETFSMEIGFKYKLINNEIIKINNTDKKYLLQQLNEDFEIQVAKLTSGIPESEKKTWTEQKNEAQAWLLDNSVSTPLLDAMLVGRGDTKEYLVSKIIEKSNAYTIAIGTLTGARQIKEKEILGI